MSLRRATQTVTQYYDMLLAPSGVKSTQFALLNRIYSRETVCIGELAQAAGLDRTTMGKNLQLLANSGLITLSAGEDRRERVAQLTKQGRETLEIATPLWKQAQETMTTVLGVDRLGALRSLLADLETATN